MKSAIWFITSLLVMPVFAHDIITTKLTYSRDIAPILKKHCLVCHSSESRIPLTSYEEVRPWAVAIKEQVLSRSMPPWGAIKGFGELAPDDSLTEEEIIITAAWVVGGAPPGKPAVLQDRGPVARPSEVSKSSRELLISTRRVLRLPMAVSGIRPNPQSLVKSAQITARFPNGHIEPLLWLYEYDPQLRRVFPFSSTLKLPRGTRIESTAPLQFYLELVAKAPLREP